MIYNSNKSSWEVEYTDEFERWLAGLSTEQRRTVLAKVKLIEEFGPDLRFPQSSAVMGTRLGNLRELRVQSKGRPLRVLYAFDSRRIAIVLLGGSKTGDSRWYEVWVPVAERLYREHLARLEAEAKDGEEIP